MAYPLHERTSRQQLIELLEAVPLSIGQIAWIGIVHASECSSCCHYTFLPNTFSISRHTERAVVGAKEPPRMRTRTVKIGGSDG